MKRTKLFNLILPFLFPLLASISGTSQNQAAPDERKLKVAILNSPETSEEVDLLSARLSSGAFGFSILERSDFGAVLEETRLNAQNLPPTLDGADALVLVERIDLERSSYLATRIINRSDGRILTSDIRPLEGFEREWPTAVAAMLQSADPEPAEILGDSSEVRISIDSIREEFVPGRSENEIVGIALERLVSADLLRYGNIRVLERRDLDLVQFERYLTKVDFESFARADVVVTGSYRNEPDGTHFTLLLSQPGRSGAQKLEGKSPSGKLNELGAAIAKKLADHLTDSTKVSPPGPRFDGPSEAARYASEADRSMRLGFHQSAANCAETASLLEIEGNFDYLLLFAFADLFASFKNLDGVGIDVSRFPINVQTTRIGENNRLDLGEILRDGNGRGRGPLPSKDQWAAFARASERATDLAELLSHMSEEERELKSLRVRLFCSQLGELFRESLPKALEEFAGEIPASETDSLGRIADASDRLEMLIETGPRARMSPIFNFLDLFERLILERSRDAALVRLEDSLYSPGLVPNGLHDSATPTPHVARAKSARNDIFRYFETQGFRNQVDRGTFGEDRLNSKPFVAWFSGSGMKLDDAFDLVRASAAKKQPVLIKLDWICRQSLLDDNAESKTARYAEMRAEISSNLKFLRDSGMLEFYAVSLADWEQGRDPKSTDLGKGDFWKSIHREIYANNAPTSGDLTRRLVSSFDGAKWFHKNTDSLESRAAFLDSLSKDVTENSSETLRPGRHLILQKIEEARAAAARARDDANVDDYAKTGIQGVPQQDTMLLNNVAWINRIPVAASCSTSEGTFLFQLGNSRDDWPSRITRFSFSPEQWQIEVPDEVHQIAEKHVSPWSEAGSGAMTVSNGFIKLAFPGGTAFYDRRTEVWDVTSVPFLEKRSGMRFIGDYLVSYTGRPLEGNGPPVQGLYSTSASQGEVHAFVDTSRRPAGSILDNSHELFFSFPPLPLGAGKFLIGMQGNLRPWMVFRGYLEATPAKPGSPSFRGVSPVPFAPGDHALVRGTSSNGYALVVAARKNLNKSISIDEDVPIHYGAFAIDSGGKTHWLLDTGTLPSVGKLTTGQREFDRRMFIENQTPLYRLPSEALFHRGPHDLRPVIHFNGRRLILFTGQITSDGRRITYVWSSPQQEIPKRVPLKFDGFSKEKNLEESDRVVMNLEARNTLHSVFSQEGYLFLQYNRGFFLVSDSETKPVQQEP